ncbi:MAG: CBS domain-containing protein, partial [Firmicutes bacterium]|nr:CBS domain-containing protein [Bacillota bacterium]
YYVPETVKADVLFRNMKKTKNRLAVVLDEYGGMRGIVTINDLVEELVGDFNKETFDDQYMPT